MNVFELSGRVTEPLDPRNFTGNGTLVRMAGVCDSPSVNAYRVTFEPGARTAWHTHSGPQLLLVVDGLCRVQLAGEPIVEVGPGGIISIGPGEAHWHGATPEASTTHVAINVDTETVWLEKVTEEEYSSVST